MEEIERIDELSSDSQDQVQEMSWQSLLSACNGDYLNESAISSRFQRDLVGRIVSNYPLSRSGLSVEANVSGVMLSFLRLPLDQDLAGEGFTDKYAKLIAKLKTQAERRVRAAAVSAPVPDPAKETP